MLPMPPYRLARQQHLGEQLHVLQDRGLLSWRGEFVVPPGRDTTCAVWWIRREGATERRYDTREAEQLVQRLSEDEGLIWEPVPHPGGKEQRRQAQERMEARRQEAG